MSGPCPFGEVPLQPPASVLPTLNRTFTWDVQAHKSIGLELQFSRPRLRQIGPGDSCPDGVTHSISGRIDSTTVKIGTFCSNGTVSRIKMQGGVKMALHLPWFHDRNTSGFSIANRSSIKREHTLPCPCFAEVETGKITTVLDQSARARCQQLCMTQAEHLPGSSRCPVSDTTLPGGDPPFSVNEVTALFTWPSVRARCVFKQ